MPAVTASIRDSLVFHFECLQGMYFSTHEENDHGHLLFSDRITDPYYNFFAPADSAPLDPAVRRAFTERNRTPAVYLTPLAEGLPTEPGVSTWASDAWLIGTAESLSTSARTVPNLRVEEIDGRCRDIYVDTFTAAYSGDDPDDPYGQLDPAYAECLRDSFDHDVPGYRKYYVMASLGDIPVGVATLFTAGSLAGVYGVGTIPAFRQRGIGEAIMAYLADIAFRDKAVHVLLQTEAGSPVHRWYEKLGYYHAFTAPYMIPSDTSNT
jgi:GNAT superfamily N-acetyltransferase